MDTNETQVDRKSTTKNDDENSPTLQPKKAKESKVRITMDQVDTARKALAGLRTIKKNPKEAKPGLNGQEFVKKMYSTILSASEKGYSMQQISDMLWKDAKVKIPANTLKNYMSRAKAARDKDAKDTAANLEKTAKLVE